MSAAWLLSPDEITLDEKIAEGGYGSVYKGTLHQHWVVAVKNVFNSAEVHLSEDSEIRFLQRARHPRLVMFLGCGKDETDGNIFVVMEYMTHGSLDKLLWTKKRRRASSAWGGDDSTPPTWASRLQILMDVAEGMAYIHFVFAAIHRDLKSPNVLLCAEDSGALRAKIADFGMAKFMSGSEGSSSDSSVSSSGRKSKKSVLDRMRAMSKRSSARPGSGTGTSFRGQSMSSNSSTLSSGSSTNSGTPLTPCSRPIRISGSMEDVMHVSASMTTGVGTTLWMAPEIVRTMGKHGPQQAVMSQAIDTYAFGIILWEALMLVEPWSNMNLNWTHEIFSLVEKGVRPKLDKNLTMRSPRGYVQLMEDCYAQNPKSRPPFNSIIRRLQDAQIAHFKHVSEGKKRESAPRRRPRPPVRPPRSMLTRASAAAAATKRSAGDVLGHSEDPGPSMHNL